MLPCLFMVTLWNRANHYIFILWFLLSFLFPRLISAVADWMSTMRLAGYTGRKKSPSAHHRTTLSGYIFVTKAHIDNRKKLVKQQYLPTCLHNMVNFEQPAAEIISLVWGTPANFNGFRVLAALLHGTVLLGVSQTLRR